MHARLSVCYINAVIGFRPTCIFWSVRVGGVRSERGSHEVRETGGLTPSRRSTELTDDPVPQVVRVERRGAERWQQRRLEAAARVRRVALRLFVRSLRRVRVRH